MLGSWGPGWFTDAFDVEVSFDNNPPKLSDSGPGGEGEVFCDPWYAYDGSMRLFCGPGAVVNGNVTLSTYSEAKVQHLGINISIGEYIHFLDPYVPARLKNVCVNIAGEDIVEGECTYPFSIPLSTLNQAAVEDSSTPLMAKGEYPNLTHWLNSYNGNSFAIRHLLVVEVCRPWYTFNLYRYNFLSFQMMDQSSNQNCINFPNENSRGGEQSYNVSTRLPSGCNSERIVPETFHIDGLTDSGKGRVSLVSTHINLSRSPRGYSRGGGAGDGAIIQATLQLSDLQETIVSAKCMLIRAEYVGSKNSHDALECEHLIFGIEEADSVELLEDEVDRHLRLPMSKGYISRQDVKDDVVETPQFIDPVRKGTVINFEICLDGSTRVNEMNSAGSSASEKGPNNNHVSHQTRIQNSLWQNLAYQLYPTFYYLPLDLMREESDVSASALVPTVSDNTSELKIDCTQRSPALEKSNTEKSSPAAQSTSHAEIFKVSSDESVCLRYFLRVVLVEKSGRKLWETVELVFYYYPKNEASLQKGSFLSARNSHVDDISASVIPPYLAALESDELTEKNENV